MNQKSLKQSNIELAKANAGVGGRLNLEGNQQFNGYNDVAQVYDQAPLRPNYTRQELNNAEIPNQIGKEIRAQKYRIFFIEFISALMIIVATFFIACYWGAKEVDGTKWLIPTKSVLHPGFAIPMLAVGLVAFVLSTIEYSQLLKNVRSYKADILDGRESVPYFLIKSYKSLIARVIYTNWACLALYIVEAIIISVLCGMNWWPEAKYIGNGADRFHNNMWTPLIIMFVITGLTFVFQMGTIISSKVRRGGLDAFFNSQIVSDETQAEIRKHANKVSIVSFVAFIFIVLIIPSIVYLILRKKKQKPILP